MYTAGKIIKAGLSITVFILLIWAAQKLVQPKYADELIEGNFTAEYYNETTDHDVIIIGDCEVYENIDPIYLWEHYGITSYIRGNAQQLAWQSYYMLEDTLRYEIPKVVIYNVQALMYDEPQKEEYNRMTLDGMKWSKTKYEAIKASMCNNERMLEYIFPIFRYHSRIMNLSKEDLKYYFKRKKVANNGYYMRIDVLPVSESDVADMSWLIGDTDAEKDEIIDPWADIETEEEENEISLPEGNAEEKLGNLSMEYLDKIRNLCDENGIKLILIKAPSLAPIWYDSYDKQIMMYSRKYNLRYINFYELLEETGIDYETDTYDGGLHMNRNGADKISEYLGDVLSREYEAQDHRGDMTYDKVYEQKRQFYYEMIDAQKKEIEQYGRVKNY